MTEEDYSGGIAEYLGQFTERVVNLIGAAVRNRDADCWAFVIYPERFHSELGIELRRILVEEHNSTNQEYVLGNLSGPEPCSIPEELNPQDFLSEPEDRFDLLTKAAVGWLESFLNRCGFQSPVYAGGPDDLRFYSFRDRDLIKLPFWI